MKKYNPDIHHRRSVRLRGYDYSQAGAYFITKCAHNRRCIFGEIRNKEMYLNPFGEIAYREWEELPKRWQHLELGAFQIMPNHIHGVLVINDPQISQADDLSNPKIQWAKKPTVGQVVGAYDSITVTQSVKYIEGNSPDMVLGKLWQRGFHEHIIRTLESFDRISHYIINNPADWENDKFFNP